MDVLRALLRRNTDAALCRMKADESPRKRGGTEDIKIAGILACEARRVHVRGAIIR